MRFGHRTRLPLDRTLEAAAPGVLDELERKNLTLPSGYRKNKHHQWFTPEPGHQMLKEHLAAVIALMRAGLMILT